MPFFSGARRALVLKRTLPFPVYGTSVALSLISYGVDDWTPGIGVARSAYGRFAPSMEAAEQLAAFTAGTTIQTYYVNSSTGVTANPGTQAAPFLNLVTAVNQLPAAPTIEVRVVPLPSRIIWGSRGSLSTSAIKRNLILRADDGGELIIAGCSVNGPPTWTDNGDGTYTCSSNVAVASVSPPVDWSKATRAEQIDGLGQALTLTVGTTAANDTTIRDSLTPGSAYKNSTTGTADLTIRPFGNRPLNTWQDYLIPVALSANILFVTATDDASDSPFYYFSQIAVTGGSPFVAQNRRTTVGGRGKIILDRCSAVGTTGSANAVAIIGAWLLHDYDFKCDAIREDALNLHSGTNGNSLWVNGDAWAVHVRPKVNSVGLANSGASNNQTEHENCRALAIMPTYRGGNGRPYASIDTAKSIIFGGSIGPSTRAQASAYFETVAAGWTSTMGSTSGAQLALVETTIAASPYGNVDIKADVGGVCSVKCYGMTQGALRIDGNVTFPVMPLPAVAGPVYIVQNASALRMPGDDSAGTTPETTILTSAGSAVPLGQILTNLSGAPMTEVAAMFTQWVHAATGSTTMGNDNFLTAEIKNADNTVTYGTLMVAGNSSFTVPDGTTVQTDWCTLTTPIPAGGTYYLRSVSTLTTGQKYPVRNGLTAVLSRTSGVARINRVIGASGDSMTALYGGTWLRGIEKSCPVIQASIFGTSAATYATTANFSRQLDVFQRAGCTDFIANWSINDIVGGASAATLQTRVSSIRDAVTAKGMQPHWTTLTGGMANTSTATGSVGTMVANNKMRLTVANPSWYVVGSILTLTENVASTPVAFNEGFAIVESIDSAANTVTFTVVDRSASGRVSGTVGTGTITVSQGASSNNAWLSGGRATASPAGTNAARVAFNTWLRGSGHGMASVLDLAASIEAIPDSGINISENQGAGLFPSRVVTVTAVTSTTQFTVDGGPYGDDTFMKLIWLSGPNIGTAFNRGTGADGSQGNAGNVFTLSSATSTLPTVGDTAYAQFYGVKALTELDGLHYVAPVDGFAGGFGIAVRAVKAWADARLSGPQALPDNGSGGGILIARDNFTRTMGGVYNTNLYNQLSTSGHLWYRTPGYTYTQNRASFTKGRVYPPAGGMSAYLDAIPPSLDSFADAKFTCLTSVAAEQAAVFLHMVSPSVSTRYSVTYDRANSRWGLTGPGITAVYFADTFPAGTSRIARIQRVGTTISMFIDIGDGNGMVLRQSATDASGTITAPGRAGFRLPQNGSAAAGIHMDYLRLSTLGPVFTTPPSISPTNGTANSTVFTANDGITV
jgi:hypothetical protein